MSVNDFRVAPTTDVFEVHYGPSTSCATFIFGNEDHTLGNTIRYILMQHPETDFCGYSVPHPYEPKMNVRLQTKAAPVVGSGKKASSTSSATAPSAVTVLRKGLNDMVRMCDVLDAKFDAALAAHASKGSASAMEGVSTGSSSTAKNKKSKK